MKRIICHILISFILFMNGYGAANASAPDHLDLLCPQQIDQCFSLPGGSEAGKQVGLVTALDDGTFLVGETGNSCYRVNEHGSILNQFTLCHPDHEENAVHMKAGTAFDNRFLFAAYDYSDDGSYIASFEPNGIVHYSETIQAAIEEAIPLEDGLLLCGSAKVKRAGETHPPMGCKNRR